MTAIIFSRRIGPVPIDCVVSERHTSEIEITGNPIETGAEVNDHAYVMPKRVTLDVVHGDVAATYAALVRFQEARIPFVLVTGLTAYPNMLIKAVNADRDRSFSRVLRATIDLQEVIIVSTAYAAATGPRSGGQPGGANSTGAAPPAASATSDPATASRATGTVQRGDVPTTSVPAPRQQSLARRMF